MNAFKEQAYAKPDYQLTVNGRNITRAIKSQARLISLTLTESRGDEADTTAVYLVCDRTFESCL